MLIVSVSETMLSFIYFMNYVYFYFISFRFTVQRQDIQHYSKITRGPDDTEVLQHVVEGEEQGWRVYRLDQETD